MMSFKRNLCVTMAACLFLFSSLEAVPRPGTRSCKTWCKTAAPTEGGKQFYCCEDDPYTPVHSGHCPPLINSFCGEKALASPGFKPPKRCKNDGGCAVYEKCCPDKCIGDTVCKPALS